MPVYAHAAAIVIAFALITYFEVLLGELVPKSLALQRAERIALAVAGPMDVFIRMTRPAIKVMNCFGDEWCCSCFGRRCGARVRCIRRRN